MTNTNLSQTTSSNSNPSNADDNISVIRGRLGNFVVYEISKEELERLKQGSGTTELSFALSLLTMAITLLVALNTADVKSQQLFTVFTLFVIVGIILGIYFLITWIVKKRTIKELVKSIESRVDETER